MAKIAPNSEMPNEPPIERKKVAAPLAAPRSFCSTLFCAISIEVCIRKPMPTPSTTMYSEDISLLVSTSSMDSSAMPAVITTPPMIGNARYLPVG